MKLTEGNYVRWKRQMMIVLEASDLLSIVTGDTPRPNGRDQDVYKAWRKSDLEAQAAILTSCDDTNMDTIADSNTSKDMWDKLSAIHSDTSLLNQTETFSRFYSYEIKEGQSLVAAYQELERLAKEIRNMGENISDKAVIAKIVLSLPRRHDALRKAWASVPIGQQSMTALLTRLKQEDRERIKEDNDQADEDHSSKAFKSGTKFGAKSGFKMSIAEKKKVTKCAKCGVKGHWAKECKSRGPHPESKGQSKSMKAFAADDDQVLKHSWVSDSGASSHFCGDLSWFTSYTEFEEKKPIYLTSGVTYALGKGTVTLSALYGKVWEECTLSDVLYVPGSVNLFSESKCAKLGCKIIRKGNRTLFFGPNGTTGPIAYLDDGVYIMKFKRVREEASYFSQAQLWHERCAHMNIDYTRKTVRQGAISGISEEQLGGEFSCEGCALGKLSKLPHPSVENKLSMSVGEMLHADISGPIPTKSIGGASYMLLIKDEASAFTTVYFLKKKHQCADMIMDYVSFIETQTENKVKVLKSDSGTEFTCSYLQTCLSKKGIVHQTSTPYTPQSNGKIERHIWTIKDYARSMLNRHDSP